MLTMTKIYFTHPNQTLSIKIFDN